VLFATREELELGPLERSKLVRPGVVCLVREDFHRCKHLYSPPLTFGKNTVLSLERPQ